MLLLSLLCSALADDTTTGARIGPVPVAEIADETFWSHVTITPILRAPGSVSMDAAAFDVLAGTVSLTLRSTEAIWIDWSGSYLQVAGVAVPVRFTPLYPAPMLDVSSDTYGYTHTPPHRRHGDPGVSAIPTGGTLRGTLTRLDSAPLLARPQPGDSPPEIVLRLVEGGTVSVTAGLALERGLIPAHCADMKQRRGEGWMNLVGGVVLTGGLAFTSGRIYSEEREVLGTTVPTLPTAGLLALTGAAVVTTGVMGARVGAAYRDHAEQCPEP